MSAIIVMTWKEMLRKRVVLLTLMMTVLFLFAFWFVARTIGTEFGGEFGGDALDPGSADALIAGVMEGAVTLTVGFFFASFVIAFLSIFSSVSVIAGEAEQGVMQSLLSRPISRVRLYLGRWTGYVSLGAAYALLLFLAILVITEIHTQVPGGFWPLLKAFLLFASVVPLLVSVAMLGSCYVSAMGNGVCMTMLFGAGWLGGMLNKITSVESFGRADGTLHMIGGLLDMAMPADALQRRMLAELFSLQDIQPLVNLGANALGPFGIAAVPSDTFLLYALGYVVLALLLGLRSFRKKDL